MNSIVMDFVQTLLDLDRLAAKKIVDEHAKGMSSIKFIEDVIAVALERIGTGWQKGTFALSQVYMAGRICEDLVDKLLPPDDPNRKDQPQMAICVLNDHHQLGKIIVYSLLRASGFEIADYGVVGVDDLVDRIEKEKIQVLLISVLMFPSALKIKSVREKLNKSKSNANVKIIVGGAPFRFDDQLWKSVGADAMCENASEAVSAIETVMRGVG